MRNGDISNKSNPTILIRVNECLFYNYPENTFFNKIKRGLNLPLKYKVDLRPSGSCLLTLLQAKENINVKLIFIEGLDVNYKEKLKVLEDNFVPLEIHKISEVDLYSLIDNFKYYLVDDSSNRNGVITLNECLNYIKNYR